MKNRRSNNSHESLKAKKQIDEYPVGPRKQSLKPAEQDLSNNSGITSIRCLEKQKEIWG